MKKCNITIITDEMDKLHTIVGGSVRMRIFSIVNTLRQLQQNDAAIEQNRLAIQEMRLNDIKKI